MYSNQWQVVTECLEALVEARVLMAKVAVAGAAGRLPAPGLWGSGAYAVRAGELAGVLAITGGQPKAVRVPALVADDDMLSLAYAHGFNRITRRPRTLWSVDLREGSSFPMRVAIVHDPEDGFTVTVEGHAACTPVPRFSTFDQARRYGRKVIRDFNKSRELVNDGCRLEA